jgi:endonuclease/exonuclease/phosphatase family protein
MTVASLTDLVRQFSPSVVFLSETKCSTGVIKKIQKRTGLVNGVWVDSAGRAGGLALLWNQEENVNLRSMSGRHIDVIIIHPTGVHWRFTGIYGWSEYGQKHHTWDLLKRLGNESEMAWLVGGDFNEVLFAHEKRGGCPGHFCSMKAFRDTLNCHNLRDVSFTGYPFTWSNGRSDGYIEERLDRMVANSVWHDIFRDAVSETVIWDSSDHYPLCLHFGGIICNDKRSSLLRKKLFRFEAKWLQADNFDTLLKDLWNKISSRENVSWMAKVKQCGKHLMKWDSETFKHTQWRITWLKRRLKRLKTVHQSRIIIDESREVEKELRELRRLEETAAWQRCQPYVLRDGDKNTAFFHAKAASRLKRNNIKMLLDMDGTPQTSFRSHQEGCNQLLQHLVHFFSPSHK